MAVKCKHANITLGSPLASSCCDGIELFLLLTLSLGTCHYCCWGKRLDEVLVHASHVCKMLTGELSKGPAWDMCLCNPAPQRAERAGQAELLVGMLCYTSTTT